MYAEDEDDYLLFQASTSQHHLTLQSHASSPGLVSSVLCMHVGLGGQWTDGELQLVETNFTRKINRSLFAYLERCNSYPAFLSSLTLDLFGKQTMC